jgi:tetratricopeptide (TPR) repeat protein
MSVFDQRQVLTLTTRLLFAVMLVACLSASLSSQFVWAGMFSDAEIKAMPPYCEARYKRTPGQYEYWQQQLGPDFLHVHHLCDGYGFLNRYFKAKTQLAKQTALNDAMGTLNYMINHAKPEFALMPEVYYNRAQVFSLQNKPGDALRDAFKAIELNPKMILGYSLATSLLAKAKRTDEALNLVTEGLRINRESSSLRRLYDKYGGKQPYPEPLPPAAPAAPPTADPPPQAVPPQGAEQPSAPVAKASERQEAAPVSGVDSGQTAATVSPNNPWCRFCPVAK